MLILSQSKCAKLSRGNSLSIKVQRMRTGVALCRRDSNLKTTVLWSLRLLRTYLKINNLSYQRSPIWLSYTTQANSRRKISKNLGKSKERSYHKSHIALRSRTEADSKKAMGNLSNANLQERSQIMSMTHLSSPRLTNSSSKTPSVRATALSESLN